MLGWSIHVKHEDKSVLFAETSDLGLDKKIRDQADEILDSNDYASWGYGYPNRYLIHNNQLPRVTLYRCALGDQLRTMVELGPLLNIPGDALLWVELWDLS